MLARTSSYLLQGIDALYCEVEVDFDECEDLEEGRSMIVGLPDAAVRESIDRVRAALFNSGAFWPKGRTLINLAPADNRKEGPLYDLPIAVALLAKHAGGYAKVPELTEASIDKLESYDWPGNVRELENVLQRALVLSGGRQIDPEHLMIDLQDLMHPLIHREPALLRAAV